MYVLSYSVSWRRFLHLRSLIKAYTRWWKLSEKEALDLDKCSWCPHRPFQWRSHTWTFQRIYLWVLLRPYHFKYCLHRPLKIRASYYLKDLVVSCYVAGQLQIPKCWYSTGTASTHNLPDFHEQFQPIQWVPNAPSRMQAGRFQEHLLLFCNGQRIASWDFRHYNYLLTNMPASWNALRCYTWATG